MDHRERIKTIIAGEKPDRCGFWLGNPHEDTWQILYKYFGINSEEEIRLKLKDDIRWICPQFFSSAYNDPNGYGMFDAGLDKEMHGQAGPFANCEDPAEVEKYPWPNPDYLILMSVLKRLKMPEMFIVPVVSGRVFITM